jgi:hypothetical protein
MLHLREPDPLPSYPVPWRVERQNETHPLIVNDGDEPVDVVRVFRSDGTTEQWGRLQPGDTIDLCLCDTDLDSVVVTVCWFRSGTGVEYAWRFVM